MRNRNRSLAVRFLSLTGLLALTSLAFLLPPTPAHAVSNPQRCAAGYQTTVIYYNDVQHQQQVGETIDYCDGTYYHTGETSPWWSETCTPC